jgi:L-fuconolactonase
VDGWIDTHAHLWQARFVARGWAPPPPLDRTYAPADWDREVGARGVATCIYVETGGAPDELDQLQTWAEASPSIAGFIAPLATDGSDVDAAMGRWAGHPKLRGFRAHHEDGPIEALRAPGLQAALRVLAAADLVYEFLVVAEHLPEVVRLCRAVPDVRVVLEHLGKPDLSGAPEAGWLAAMDALAGDTAAAVKVSISPRPDRFRAFAAAGPQGFPTDAVRRHVEAVLERFGPDRLVWGSDWPVSLLTAETAAFLEGWRSVLGPELGAALTSSAARVYRVTRPGLA